MYSVTPRTSITGRAVVAAVESFRILRAIGTSCRGRRRRLKDAEIILVYVNRHFTERGPASWSCKRKRKMSSFFSGSLVCVLRYFSYLTRDNSGPNLRVQKILLQNSGPNLRVQKILLQNLPTAGSISPAVILGPQSSLYFC